MDAFSGTPDEITEHILGQLPARDVLAFSVVGLTFFLPLTVTFTIILTVILDRSIRQFIN